MKGNRQQQDPDLNMPGEEATIGENDYMVRMLPMRDWLDLKALLLRLAGPAIAEFFANYTAGSKVMSVKGFLDVVNTKMIGAAIYTFTSQANAKEYARVLEILGSCTWVNGKQLGKRGQESYWPRHMKELVGYMRHAFTVLFRDFISGLQTEMPLSEPQEEQD